MLQRLALFCLIASVPMAQAQLRLPNLLSSGAVLQRDRPVPIWGEATPGGTVEVMFNSGRQSAVADDAGRWSIAFPALAGGATPSLSVRSGDETREVTGLVVGDVWVLSGQSNMEWTVAQSRDADAEIAAPADPLLRHFKVPAAYAESPQSEVVGGGWELASPETVGGFSAVGTFFARSVREHHDVPIGLVHASLGGSRIEAWMSAEMLGLDEQGAADVFDAERARQEAVYERLREQIGGLPERDEGMDGDTPLWAARDLDDSGWTTLAVPARWDDQGYDLFDGSAWYRTTFALSAEAAAQGVTLHLGEIDDDDVTWVNGVEVGRTEGARANRQYRVPPSALHPGDNVLAIRVVDHGWWGGLVGPDAPCVEVSGDRQPLPSPWRFRVGAVRMGAVGEKRDVPMGLWNQMVHPLLPMPVAGVLWYQGESNAGPGDAQAYADQFQTLIRSWRDDWGQPDVPFYWVQLAGYQPAPVGPDDVGTWPALRESQTAALALPHTAQALALDVGDAGDVHPRDKQTVGRRLALAARALVYGEDDLEHEGPRYRSHEVEGGRIRVAFDAVGSGLTTRGGMPLGGYAVAGADGAWHWAKAHIEGPEVVVQNPAVPAPVAVRYGWADNPEAATLSNMAGLPAEPFWAGDRFPTDSVR